MNLNQHSVPLNNSPPAERSPNTLKGEAINPKRMSIWYSQPSCGLELCWKCPAKEGSSWVAKNGLFYFIQALKKSLILMLTSNHSAQRQQGFRKQPHHSLILAIIFHCTHYQYKIGSWSNGKKMRQLLQLQLLHLLVAPTHTLTSLLMVTKLYYWRIVFLTLYGTTGNKDWRKQHRKMESKAQRKWD